MTKAYCKFCDDPNVGGAYHQEGCEDNHREHIHRFCSKCDKYYTVVPSDVH
jgi:RNase P subunit RPR2